MLRRLLPIVLLSLAALAGSIEMLIAARALQGMGGALYVESIARALIVHLLRRYASVKLSRPAAAQELGPAPAIECFVVSQIRTAIHLCPRVWPHDLGHSE